MTVMIKYSTVSDKGGRCDVKKSLCGKCDNKYKRFGGICDSKCRKILITGVVIIQIIQNVEFIKESICTLMKRINE